jgi:hypothetical protein
MYDSPWAWLDPASEDEGEQRIRDGVELIAGVLDRYGPPVGPKDVLRRAELLVEERPRATARAIVAASVELERGRVRLEQLGRRIEALTFALVWAVALIAVLGEARLRSGDPRADRGALRSSAAGGRQRRVLACGEDW